MGYLLFFNKAVAVKYKFLEVNKKHLSRGKAMYPLGSHLVAKRNFYTHHGIYIGNNEVIHYGGLADGFKKDRICKVSLTKFKGSANISLYDKEIYLKGEKYTGEEIVRRAKSRVDENKYSVFWNNCETFANWCTHDDEFSSQTDGILGRHNDNEIAKGNILPLARSGPTGHEIEGLNKLMRKIFKR